MSREKLKETLDEAEWGWLRDHAERDGLIIVARELELLDVGEAIASDDSKQVGAWIGGGQLTKPTQEQLAEWNETPARRFMALVVSPYVLIQELALH
jgi:hypothetical protein